MKRRDLIKGGLLAGIAGVTGIGCSAHASGAAAPAPSGLAAGRRTVRNIIFLVYDGFNFEDLALGRYLAAIHAPEARDRGGVLELERLLSDGSAGVMLTHSLVSVVTDSSAASAAWATGRKIVNGAVSMYPDGRELRTILDLAREAGKATGLITTTRLTHATPACWIARVPDRGSEDEIAQQYLAFQPDVLLGGGLRHFAPDRRSDGRDLVEEFRQAGYTILRSPRDLAGLQASRVLGAFTDDHLPYEIDRRFQHVAAPSLADITRAGLDVLNRHPGGFVVQVEAGRIDHANHGNDPGAAAWDILAADEALRVIRDFVDRNPDTLLLMASDHATGGQVVYGFGSNYNSSSQALATLEACRASHDYLRWDVLPRDPSPAQVQEAVRHYLGFSLSDADADQVVEVLARRLRLGHPIAHGTEPANSLYHALSRSRNQPPDRPNIHFATGAHTAGLVPVCAYGAWDGPGNLGVVDNTELFAWMAAALGSDFRNPVMTEAEARQFGQAPVEPPVLAGPVHT
jgi:alkaline phosphatase